MESELTTKGAIIQVLCSVLACMAILSPGMNMGYSAFALKYMRKPLHLTTNQETWIASLSNLVTPIGCLISGPILERFGRKFSLILVSIPCTIGWFLIAFEPNLTRIYIGRILTGLATGLASTPASVYAAETAVSNLRGFLMSGSTVFISTGILIVNILGMVFEDDWQKVALIGGCVSITVALLTLICIPESPIWLISKDKNKQAAKCLQTLRGTSRPEAIQEELNTMLTNKRNATARHEKRNIWKDLTRPEAYKPLIILNIFFLFQQLTGIYVAVSYTLDFVRDSGVTAEIALVAVSLGALRLIVIFFGTICSKTLGRRFTAIVSGVGMTPCLLILAVDRYLNRDVGVNKVSPIVFNALNTTSLPINSSEPLTSTLPTITFSIISATPTASSVVTSNVPTGSWIPLVTIVLYIIFSAFGFLIIPWSLLGEVYPAKSRDVACGITACLAYLFNFAVIKYYPYMLKSLHSYGVFLLFGVMALLGTIFVIIFLPETQGKTLQEIEQYFITGSKGRRSSTDNDTALSPNGTSKRPIIVGNSS